MKARCPDCNQPMDDHVNGCPLYPPLGTPGVTCPAAAGVNTPDEARPQMTDEWLEAAFNRAAFVSGDTVGNLLRGFANRVLQKFGDRDGMRDALNIAYERSKTRKGDRA